MIEMYILQECFNFKFNDMQFGFVRGRGTNTAISQANGACYYFVNKVVKYRFNVFCYADDLLIASTTVPRLGERCTAVSLHVQGSDKTMLEVHGSVRVWLRVKNSCSTKVRGAWQCHSMVKGEE